MGGAVVDGSPRDIRWEECVQNPLIFMHFHGVSLGNQHEMWSKQHNGKVRSLSHRQILSVEIPVYFIRKVLKITVLMGFS
jgi:hypothetical protein